MIADFIGAGDRFPDVVFGQHVNGNLMLQGVKNVSGCGEYHIVTGVAVAVEAFLYHGGNVFVQVSGGGI
ncbi:hypothetical protein UF75_3807 [Desulfosporosinus sp. I2]|nr:hypothetical protein UF75_3807 [Desulfosporosinus sp. I2]